MGAIRRPANADPVGASECVKVGVRIRPLNARERLGGNGESIVCTGPDTLQAGAERQFRFDCVLGPTSTQQDVYAQCVRPLVLDSFLQGFNATVFAYGQTGSGKTHTMGTNQLALSASSSLDNEEPAVIARSIADIFDHLSREASESVDLYVSFLEIYNEQVRDLLCCASTKTILTIREHSDGDIYVAGLTEERIVSREQLIQKGSLGRTTKSTEMNMVSSRSHAVLTLLLRRRVWEEKAQSERHRVSKLHFVDLAGSERLKRTNVQGERVKESISINSGLLALGNVISALSSDSSTTPNNSNTTTQHVPYRDSKLTRLLQDSLGGNARTVMIACVSASTDDLAESVNTLRYADRARSIRNRAVLNESLAGEQFELMQLRKQVAALKQDLLDARSSHNITTMDSTGNSDDYRRRCEQLEREKLMLQQEVDTLRRTCEGLRRLGPSSTPSTTNNTMGKRPLPLRNASRAVVVARSMPSVPNAAESPPPSPVASTVNSLRAFVAEAKQRLNRRVSLIRSVELTQDEEPQQEEDNNTLQRRLEEMLEPVKADLAFKGDLIAKLEACQRDFASMRVRYDERMQLLQSNVQQLRRERDEAASKLSSTPPASAVFNHSTRQRYEERIKQLTRELKAAQEQSDSVGKTINQRQGLADNAIRALKRDVATLREENKTLREQLDKRDYLQRSASMTVGGDVQELRARERKALQDAQRWKKAYDFERTLLQRRVDQFMQAKGKIRQLLNLLRRKHIGASTSSPATASLLNLQSPGWRAILEPTKENHAGPDGGSKQSSPLIQRVSRRVTFAEPLIDDDDSDNGLDDEDEDNGKGGRRKSIAGGPLLQRLANAAQLARMHSSSAAKDDSAMDID